jgi:hypothetical protein
MSDAKDQTLSLNVRLKPVSLCAPARDELYERRRVPGDRLGGL